MNEVDAVAAVDLVVAGGADQLVVAVPAGQLVVSPAAVDEVVAVAAEDRIIARAGEDPVLAGAAVDAVVTATAPDEVVPTQTTDDVVPGGADEEIPPVRSDDRPGRLAVAGLDRSAVRSDLFRLTRIDLDDLAAELDGDGTLARGGVLHLEHTLGQLLDGRRRPCRDGDDRRLLT